ncbi:Nucleotide-binding universal stress protein, UspA family [Litoreibacter ascidiaceicola]|uniref:Nucleotide-binding universal stress protein, UspA family n=1 Tax=Litoreibacter ascidiaceicola TaxID=1486859 RepID=A0A1M5CNQ6_9RHOB|nr:universal stress protein [Litoreibacter ascidiaceicola]SHF56353.1 Nucleotide-binding universal stress protein, UspA family [Litoreibacter ascidiaceicola]
MYKNILVPVVFDKDHDTQASYAVARALADKNAKFTVAHVIEDIPDYVTTSIPRDVLASTRREAEASLAQAAKDLSGSTPKMISGHAGRSIVDYANDNDIDCIVLASHRPGFSDLFLGSTAARVVRHAKCAVHVIR